MLFEANPGTLDSLVIGQVPPSRKNRLWSLLDGSIPNGLPNVEDGLRAARITDAVLASAAGGPWMEVPLSGWDC